MSSVRSLTIKIKMVACIPVTAPIHRLFLLLLLIKGLNCMYDEEGPTFTDEPQSKVEFINELGVRLNCSARGRPQPTIQWTSGDGSPLSEVPRLRYSSASDGSLVFAPFPAESFRPDVHSATYRCIAANSVGTIVSRDVQLRAVVKQSYETRVQAPRTVNGFPAILECVVNPSYMRDYVLVTSWVRDKSFNILPTTSLSSTIIDSSSDNKYHIMSDGRLLIWQVGPQDARFSYQCRTLHRLTGQTSVSPPGKLVTFDVDRPSRPMIQYRLSSIVAKENEQVVLPCFAHGLPKPSYRWYKKEGSRLTSVIDDSPDESGHHIPMYHSSPSDSSRNLQQHHQYQSSSSSYRHDSSSSSADSHSNHPNGGSSSNSGSASSSSILASSSGIRLLHGALIINSVKVANKGLYLCNVSNSEGSELLEIELIVRSPLTVNLHPKKLSVDLGKSAEFTCSIMSGGEGRGESQHSGQSLSSSQSSSSSSSASIHWLKDGMPLLSAAGTSGGSRVRFIGHNRISIQSVTREDQGLYQCVAKNDYGSVQQSAQLWLGDAYPQFIYRFIEQTLQPGPAVSLKCSCRGNPTPSVSWLLDGWPLPQSDRFLIGQYANVYGDVISHVNITSVRVEDGGEYECVFENRAGKARHAARLNIYGQPFVRAMPDLLATAGQRMTIKCPVGGFPVEIVLWERDGIKLPMTDRQTVSTNGTLIVEPVDRPDAGSYTCLAGSKQGSVSQRTVNVRVMVPPKITPFSFAADPHVGERASIQCVVVKGDLPLTITWLKDNYPIITNINSGSLLLPPTQSASSSSSSSSGSSSGVGSNNGMLKLHHHQQQQQLPPHDVNTHHHHMYLMSTSLLGHNNHHILSNGHGQQLGEPTQQHPTHNLNLRLSIRQLDHFSSVLSIPSLEPHHSGNYTCQARNSAATSIYTTSLLVNVPPRISPFSFGDGLMEGMRTQVICTTTAGDEPLKLTWSKGGQLLESSSSSPEGDVGGGVHVSYFPPFSTILTIPNITAFNSGNYSCKVSNLAGTAVHTAELIVTVPAKWVVEPTDQSVYVGTHVAIHCQADGFPKPAIRWKQAVGSLDKKEFREVGYQTPGVLSAENGTLIISRVTEDHESHYLCQANNGVGSGISKMIRLTVNAAPRIRARPPKEMVRRGEVARLRCEAEGDEPIKISWNVKGVHLNETNDQRYSTESKPGSGPGSPAVSELVIQQVSLADRGDLECVAVNSFGHDSLRVSLLVQERPQPPKEFRALEHTSRSAVLSWALPASDNDAHVLDYVISFKEESEKWSETTTRRKSTSGDQNSLVVSGLLPAVTYHFRLQARNQLGTSEPTQVFEVTTDGEPPSGPPLYVTVEPVSSTELRISWQLPAKDRRHGRILGYSIGIKRTSEEIGLYNWTRIENTQEDVSSGGVATSSSSTSSSSLTSGSGGGSNGSGGGSGSGPSSVPVLSTILSGLDKFTEYEVVVQAYNQLGEGPTSSPAIAATLEDVPGAAPSDVTCSSSTAHSVTVTWEPPSRKYAHGNIVSFRVLLEIIPDDDEFPISLHHFGINTAGGGGGATNSGNNGGNEVGTGIPSGASLSTGAGLELDSRVTSTNTVVHGLTPYTNYSVSVTAATAVGDGVYSQPIFCRTLESVPDSPAGIKAMASSPESVIVTWQRPRNENGRIVKFHVYIRILDHGSGRELRTVHKTVSPSTWNYEVTDLKRREGYEAWVTAETRIGEGARSSSVSFTSASSVPAGIISFGKVIATPWKADVLMPCLTVGLPAPIVTWRRRGGRIIDPASNPRYVINKDSSLLIKNVQRNDNGNFSCLVKNPEGADHIVYVLHVQVPPAPPLLHPTAVTANSVRLQWKQGDNGGTPIQGFVLNFRPVGGEWEEITLARKLSTYVVEGLSCGRSYEFFLIGYNRIGGGPPSETIAVTTKGSRPVKPTAAHFLQSNTSAITLNLIAWNGSDCPVTSFVIEYKAKTATSWSLVKQQSDGTAVVVTSASSSSSSHPSSLSSSQVGANNKRVQINDLTPETDYIIRVTGNNGAGSTTAEYEISTSLIKGGLTSNSLNFNSRSRGSSSSSSGGSGGSSSNSGTSSASSTGSGNHDSSSSSSPGDNLPFYQDVHIILPLVISLLAIISVSVSALYCWRKRVSSASSSPQESSKPTKAFTFRRADGNGLFGGGGNDMGANTLGLDRDYTIIREKFISECDRIPETAEDIYPYATFHLPMKENLGENIGEGFYAATGAGQSSPRLSNAETIPIRQMARGTALVSGGGRNTSGRRKSQGGGSSGGSGNRATPGVINAPGGKQSSGDSPGESEEYDDSCGSESDDCTRPHHHHHHHHHHNHIHQQQQQQQQHLIMSMLAADSSTMSSKACGYSALPVGGGMYGQTGGRPIFLNDETLLVTDKDRKSLPRGMRSKFSYGSSSGIGSMLSPGPVSSSSAAGYQLPPGGLGRSSGSSGGSSTASRSGGGGGNYTTSTTDETSFILLSAGLGSGNPTASAAIHPHSSYDYDYDLVAGGMGAGVVGVGAQGNKYLGGNCTTTSNNTSRQTGGVGIGSSSNLPPSSSSTLKQLQNAVGVGVHAGAGGGLANSSSGRIIGSGGNGGGLLGGGGGDHPAGNKAAIKTDLISHHHHHHHHPQQQSDYTIAV